MRRFTAWYRRRAFDHGQRVRLRLEDDLILIACAVVLIAAAVALTRSPGDAYGIDNLWARP